MRLFVSIEFPTAALDKLIDFQSSLRAMVKRGRFKRPENFHLTLKFLGEVPPGDVSSLVAALDNAAKKSKPFSLRLGRLGRFGNGNPVRVIWLDVAGEVEPLRELQAQVEEAMAEEGFKPESRRWQPHITLAQDVELAGNDLPWGEISVESPLFIVTEFALILSEEKDRRRVYTPVHHFPLG